MGHTASSPLWQPDLVVKDPKDDLPKYDPLLGFPKGRKERVMIATDEEMQSACLPLDKRDYCAHLWLKYLSCYKDVFPMAYKCKHELHEYSTCQYEDYVLRLKERERERRIDALVKKNKELEAQG